MLGVLTCPGIFPTVFAILWRHQTKVAAMVSPLLGMGTGIAVWLCSAYALYGEVTVATTGQSVPCVWGTFASAFSPAVYSVVLSLYKPQNYDWAGLRSEKLAFEVSTTGRNVSVVSVEEIGVDPQQQLDLKRWGCQ